MKKVFLLLFCLMLLVASVSCQGATDDTTAASAADTTPSEVGTSNTTALESTTTAEPEKNPTDREVRSGFSLKDGGMAPLVYMAYDFEKSANLFTETVSFTLFYGVSKGYEALADENKTEFAYRITGKEEFHSLLTVSNSELGACSVSEEWMVTYPQSTQVGIACQHLQGAIGSVEFFERQLDADGNALDGWTVVQIVHYSTAGNTVYFYTPEQMNAFEADFHKFQKEWNENN